MDINNYDLDNDDYKTGNDDVSWNVQDYDIGESEQDSFNVSSKYIMIVIMMYCGGVSCIYGIPL